MGMELKALLHTLSKEQREQLADACNTTVGQLRNVASGFNPCSPLLAARLEKQTRAMYGKHRTVQRLDLISPELFAEIWPREASKLKAEA